MTNIGPLGTPGSTSDGGAGQEPNEFAEASKGRSLMVLPITLAVGLMVASGYVGNRVFVARFHSAKSADSAHSGPSTPATAVAPVAADRIKTTSTDSAPVQPAHISQPAATSQPVVENSPVTTAPLTAGEPGEALISPRPGDRYLQIAATNTKAASKLVAQLRQNNIQPSLAPGPSDGIVRVLVGPFTDEDSLERSKAQIQIIGLDSFVHVY